MATSNDNASTDWDSNEEIKLFREYLRIASVHPNIDYEPCLKFLHCQACNLELPMRVYYPVNERNPVVILTWCGTDPGKKSILLNSHMDVVPVFEDNWTHPPFGAEIDAKGKIFARGTQDMKCVGMQYLAAIRALKKSGAAFKRTIHISFVPDEEMGGKLGMRAFVQTKEFRDLNVGFALDEGIASPNDVYPVFYAERSVWHVFFKINGSSGHGSTLKDKTAAEKLKILLTKMMCLRQQEVERLETNANLTIGDVTSINMTRVYGGVENNVLPSRITACFDIRLALYVDQDEFDAKLKSFCRAAGGNIEMEYEEKSVRPAPTITDNTNQFWVALKEGMEEMHLKYKLQIYHGRTDSRFLRQLGIPVLGFSPMIATPVLMHENDEYITAATFMRGIEIYITIIPYLADATKCYCALKRSILWDGAKAQLFTSKPKAPEKPADDAVETSTTELLRLR